MKEKMKRIFWLCLTILSFHPMMAQQSDKQDFIVFTCGNDTVMSDEFWRIFNKNKKDDSKPDRTEVEEYLDLYVKFKLKVNEAYARGMDTNQAFISELNGYRRQLAQPYLTDNEVTEKLIDEAYERMKYHVKASHIMVALEAGASPADTLAAWNKIERYYQSLQKGADFDSLAYAVSEDPSAQGSPGSRGYKGDLGYFSTFQMVYPFESAAYELEVGEISKPVRSAFGYHLIHLKDKKENPGDLKAAHIMIRFNKEEEASEAKEKIDAIYAKLKEGVAFEDLVEQYTEDFSTRARGGQLNWFNYTAANVPEVFRETAFGLKNDGDYSEPVKSEYGWHIIKRIEMKPLASKEEMEVNLKSRIARDSRSRMNKEAVLKRITEENKFEEVEGAYETFSSMVDGSLTTGNWKRPESFDSSKTLFFIAGNAYTFDQFADYIERTQQRRQQQNADALLESMYREFTEKCNFDYEESVLEKKYPEFKHLMQEYRDGILLFELTDEEVWSKSVEDTLGLEAFFRARPDRYMWGERAKAEIYLCNDAKVASKVAKWTKKGKDRSEIIAKFNEKDPLAVKSKAGLYEKEKNEYLNAVSWKKGVQTTQLDGKEVVVHIKELKDPEPKKLEEAMGLATSDYQNHLEKLWIDSLRKKYKVTIPDGVIDKLMQL
jgi:peptidyl-prolyl cis-trans isomerase SurA